MKEKKIEKGKILKNSAIAPGIFEMEIIAPWVALHGHPGQFVNVKVSENTTDPLLRVPLGIHKLGKGSISLLYKVVGQGTELLSRRRKGENIDVLGPLGKGFDISAAKNTTAVIVSGGHGIAPLFALAEKFKQMKIKTVFFMGAGKKAEIVRSKELKKSGAEVYISTDDGSCGEKCVVTELVKKYLKEKTVHPAKTAIYACGPKAMIKEVAAVAKTFNIPAQVTRDEYMACGVGACRSCAVETTEGIKLACKDGPVFDAKVLKW